MSAAGLAIIASTSPTFSKSRGVVRKLSAMLEHSEW